MAFVCSLVFCQLPFQKKLTSRLSPNAKGFRLTQNVKAYITACVSTG